MNILACHFTTQIKLRPDQSSGHVNATKKVGCRKDSGVIDETPMAYKNIDSVMKAQGDLIDIVHTLKQAVCVKG